MAIQEIATALAGIRTATEIAKLIKDSGATLEKAEIRLKMAELIEALADTKLQISDIKQLLVEKDELIAKLESVAAVRAALTYDAPYYWRVDGEKKDGPFCQKCYDADGTLMRLQKGYTRGQWSCHSCKGYVEDSSYVAQALDSYAQTDY